MQRKLSRGGSAHHRVSDTRRCDAMRRDAMPRDAIRSDAMLHNFLENNSAKSVFESSLWDLFSVPFGLPLGAPKMTSKWAGTQTWSTLHGRGVRAVCDADAPLRAEDKRSSGTLSPRAQKRTKKGHPSDGFASTSAAS